MQVRAVSWPTLGDRTTFRRRLVASSGLGAIAVLLATAAPALYRPELLVPSLPLAAGALVLLLLWTHGAARSAARRAELERSFAGLTVMHHGEAFAVARQPLLGEFPSRRQAAHAALDRGGWAVIVHAWDRYYLLAARPRTEASEASPVSFRSRAVADVVPAIHDDVAVGA